MTSKNNAVPTLTAKGWITGQDFSDRIDVVLAYAFVSDHSQSVSHANKVFSVQWYLSKHAKNPIVLKSELEVQFNLLFKRHFDQSSIRIDVVENENGILDLIMRGGVTQDNKTKSLSVSISSKNSIISEVVNNLNGEAIPYG